VLNPLARLDEMNNILELTRSLTNPSRNEEST
jgi:hypothetical protein